MDEHNTYLGDGVYASFDGYQIWLAVNHHENKVVALDPQVFERLCEYANMLKEKPWVGLTDEDWKEIEDMPDVFDQGVAWCSARLQRKNT